jgi:hypothetical protein
MAPPLISAVQQFFAVTSTERGNLLLLEETGGPLECGVRLWVTRDIQCTAPQVTNGGVSHIALQYVQRQRRPCVDSKQKVVAGCGGFRNRITL